MKISKKRISIFVLLILVILFLARFNNLLVPPNIEMFNKDPKNYNAKIQIYDRESKKIAEFKIAIAKNEQQKMYGLMNLKSLPQDQGMLFPFRPNQVVNMWMKNTKIPLDIIFIDSDNEISSIHSNAEPESLEIISSTKEVRYALEINGGLSKKLGIESRQKVQIYNQ